MKQLIRGALNRLGFDLIRTRNSNDNLAKHLANVLNSRNIDCIFDVGANAGQYGLLLREIGYKGHIISFEPVKSVFTVLSEHCEGDDRWACYNYALGDKNEDKVLNVYKSTVFSSFLKANDYSKHIWQSLNDAETQTVKVFRLDYVWDSITSSLGGCRNYMLKLDTQGFDEFVFDGARSHLNQIAALQSELSMISVYDGMAPAYAVLDKFHKFGFFISGLYPINRDESLAVIEYDCIMVKRPTK